MPTASSKGSRSLQRDGWSISANDLEDTVDWYADDRCEICGSTGQTSPTALILMKEIP